MKIFYKNWCTSFLNCFLLVLIFGPGTQASDDNIHLGRGSLGSLSVNSTYTANSYAKVTAAVPAGQAFTPVTSTGGFASGSLVMIWQSASSGSGTTSTASTATDLSSVTTGHWEFAVIKSLTATRIDFTVPLKYNYASTGAQVISVPEYTSVNIGINGSIVAKPWDGQTGGIVAIVTTGTITNNGKIDASGRGFRGGVTANDATATTGGTELDIASPAAGQKGEGFMLNRYGAAYGGRGSFANGGGGGAGFKSGGGGGGHIGAGGVGGNSDLSSDEGRSVGGYGGGTLAYNNVVRLLMGGGGGAGHAGSSTGADGGNGGGVVFLRANALAGTGIITANGADAADVTNDAGSGGGAGGTVYLRLAGNTVCSSITANGGKGGSVTAAGFGPGGGGGGGNILFQSAGGCASPNWSVSGGSGGIQSDSEAPGGFAFGAADGADGSTTTLIGAFIVPTVTISSPIVETTTSDTPTFSGTATLNSTVRLVVDGTITFTVETDENGNYSYKVPRAQALSNGPHTVRAIPEYQGVSGTGTQTSFMTDSALPVKIISFNSKSEQRTVHLTWQVAAEENVDSYIIQRSSDGKHFDEIGRVAAVAANLAQATYTAKDEAPMYGQNLYRLKVVDIDGSIAYSKLTEQTIGGDILTRVSPNPATSTTTLMVDSSPGYGAMVSLTNSLGVVVRKYRIPAGSANFSLPIHREQLPAGLYFVTIQHTGGSKTAAAKLVFY